MKKHPIDQSSSTKKEFSGFSNHNPAFLLLLILVTIFGVELCVMMIFAYLPPLTRLQQAILDAALLTIIVFPSLYFLVFRPQALNIAICKRAEEAKDVLIGELKEAMAEVNMLRGIIPICSTCKKIRDDEGYWHQVESYVTAHSDAQFSHGICGECLEKLYPEYVE